MDQMVDLGQLLLLFSNVIMCLYIVHVGIGFWDPRFNDKIKCGSVASIRPILADYSSYSRDELLF